MEKFTEKICNMYKSGKLINGIYYFPSKTHNIDFKVELHELIFYAKT